MFSGFLGTRATLMFDLVVVAMAVILPLLGLSILCVQRGLYSLHRGMQISLATVLLVAVMAFEVDVRLSQGTPTDWRNLAASSPYYPAGVLWALGIHLCFSVTTPLLWGVVIIRAWRNFPEGPQPGQHSPSHRFWGWLASAGMVLTAVTGWIFYYLAFVAAGSASSSG